MKYKSKRKIIEARRAFASGEWQRAVQLITAARKIDNSPDLSYVELRSLAKMSRHRRKFLIWLEGLISSNPESIREGSRKR